MDQWRSKRLHGKFEHKSIDDLNSIAYLRFSNIFVDIEVSGSSYTNTIVPKRILADNITDKKYLICNNTEEALDHIFTLIHE